MDAKELKQLEEIFAKDPLQIAQDAALRERVIGYLRQMRANIRKAESEGKRPSKKVALDSSPASTEGADTLFK